MESIAKDIKTFIMFYMCRGVEKRSSMISRVMEDTKKKQIKLLEVKIMVFQRKMRIDGIHSRLSSAEETLSVTAIGN